MTRWSARLVVVCALPFVVRWMKREEQRGLAEGRELTAAELALATHAGIREPWRVRVCPVPRVPLPGPHWAHRLAARWGFPAEQTSGLCLRYAIFIRRDTWRDPTPLLAHEFIHTAQYERFGSPARFLRKYLVQCLHQGYDHAPLEREAREAGAALLQKG